MSRSAWIRALTTAAAVTLALAAAGVLAGPAAALTCEQPGNNCMDPTPSEITELSATLNVQGAPQSGTISSSGTTVTGSGDIFGNVAVGDVITASDQSRTVVSVNTGPSPDVLSVDAAFSADLPPGTAWKLAPPGTQAGAHPDVHLVFRFCDQPTTPDTFLTRGCTIVRDPNTNTIKGGQMAAFLRDFILHLPPGFLGNPLAGTGNPPTMNPFCPTLVWQSGSCPDNTTVGGSITQALSVTDSDPSCQATGNARCPGLPSSDVFVLTPVRAIETVGAEPARLGTNLIGATPPGPLPILIDLRSEGDYGINSTLLDIPIKLGQTRGKIIQIDTTLCGTGALLSGSGLACPAHGAPGGKPFFVNPTSCDPATIGLSTHSWSSPTVNNRTTTFTPTGCKKVPFGPEVTATPDSTQAGQPTGYTVAIQYPRSPNCPPVNVAPDCTYEFDDIWQSALKDADVTLPEGVSLAAGGAAGLEECTSAQFGFGNKDPVTCPDDSQIGTVKVTSPVLPAPLGGRVFFGPTGGRAGRPTPEQPWKLFILLEGQGLRVKLVGDVSVGPNGQVRTAFQGQPQVPFSRFELHTRGGNNAVLANPRTCGEHTSTATLTGWADSPSFAPADRKVTTSTLSVTPTGCTGSFQPHIDDASAIPTQAGAHSVSHLKITRPDGDQIIKNLTLSLPQGAAGSLAGVPLCPKAQAVAGDCSDGSKVGTIRTTVGYGDATLTQSGSLYLGEPVAPGDAASFVIAVPAKVGPIDLGKVVVINRVRLRPSDTGVDVISADIPTVFEGVPLPVKVIDITVDRDDFFINPTGCDRRLFVATFVSDQGANARGEFPAQATGCGALPFRPKLRLIAGASGLTSEGKHPPLKAIVTQSPGQANIARARVTLPDIIRPNVPQFQKPGALCNDAQLAARACPPLSNIGTAEVDTPLLPFKLSGPVFIVLRSGTPLPSLAVFLRGGGFEVRLNATNGFSGIRILNTFEPVPDVPQQHFELTVKGGSNGILNAFKDLCKTKPLPRFDATFFGHNGKTSTSKPRLESDGCVSVSSLATASIASRSVRMSRRGVVKIKVRCSRRKACKGRLSLQTAKAVKTSKKQKIRMGSKSFSIKAGKAKAVKIKLSKKARRAVIRNKRVTSRATLALRGGKRTRGTVKIKAPRKRH